MDTDIIAALVAQLGISAYFVYIFLKERTINEEITKAHLSDLREIGGLRANLQSVQQVVNEAKARNNAEK